MQRASMETQNAIYKHERRAVGELLLTRFCPSSPLRRLLFGVWWHLQIDLVLHCQQVTYIYVSMLTYEALTCNIMYKHTTIDIQWHVYTHTLWRIITTPPLTIVIHPKGTFWPCHWGYPALLPRHLSEKSWTSSLQWVQVDESTSLNVKMFSHICIQTLPKSKE